MARSPSVCHARAPVVSWELTDLDPDSWSSIVFLIVFLLLTAVASLAEGALNSISRLRFKHLREEGVAKASAVDQLLERRNVLLSTVLAVKTAAIVASTTLATLMAIEYLPGSWGVSAVAIGVALVVLTFGEIIPKALAAQDAEKAAAYATKPLEVLALVLWPLLAIIGWLTNAFVHFLGGRKGATVPLVTEEELQMLLTVGEEEGVIEEDEREMIHGIFQLEETTAREIMVPRIDIVATSVNSSIQEAIDLIVGRGYSRIPVYEDSIDNIVGVLYAKDILRCLRDGCKTQGIREILRPAHFIPETKRIDELLHELQQEKVHMAIIIDEYGGTAGLVTIEDLLEEIVGEIQDEYDREEAQVERVSADEAIVDSKLGIGHLDEMFGVKVEDEDFDTIGGFVYNQLGKIPSVGDEVTLDDLTISVLSTVGRRIKKLRIVREPHYQEHNRNGKGEHNGQHPNGKEDGGGA